MNKKFKCYQYNLKMENVSHNTSYSEDSPNVNNDGEELDEGTPTS